MDQHTTKVIHPTERQKRDTVSSQRSNGVSRMRFQWARGRIKESGSTPRSRCFWSQYLTRAQSLFQGGL